ncbi:sugar kinase [Arthrobacter sp. ISL-72]|uniref:sugar kinase n=1 Tax=Arthrobacter sp. ISL-72 TaxID=2819114 RepID=UPI001BE852AC|nr:sugar kinase [Arthrobacter sp. ISL-72]MBT2594041.1 sugar kinase [Arthrobacter sp. ISL-72]
MDVLTFGEAMVSLRSESTLALNPHLGRSIAGAESNVAIALARLGHDVQWVGCVGTDAGGELIRRTLRAESVGLDHVTTCVERQTGMVLFEQRLPDLSRVSYFRQNSAGSALQRDHLTAALNEEPRIVHVTGVTCALGPDAADAVLHAASTAKAAGAVVTFDVNYRAKLWSVDVARETLSKVAQVSDVVIGSVDELALLTAVPSHPGRPPEVAAEAGAEVAALLLAQGTREVVVKLGAGGAQVHHTNGSSHIPARRVAVVDSVGAGDAFCAGYISGLLNSLSTQDCLDLANTLGAFAVASKGDWEGLPTRPELALLNLEAGSTLR